MGPPRHVLFVCTANSARSILAEALLRHAARGRLIAHSAGSRPGGAVHPLALATLRSIGVPADGLRSKSWDEFAQPGAPHLDIVLTVCDNAAGEACPFWPGRPASAHWGLSDPAAVEDAQQRQLAFAHTAATLQRRIALLLSLPLATLDNAALRTQLADIGTR
jgi:arsenate reductase